MAFIAMTAFGSVNAQSSSRGDADKQQKKENMSEEDKERMREEKANRSSQSQDKKDKMDDHMSGDAQARAKDMTDKMDEVLDLTPDQYKKAMAINLKYTNQLEEMKTRNQGAGDDAATKEQMKAKKDQLSRDRLQQYKSILTAEQWKKFEERRGEMKSDKADHQGNGNMTKEEKKERMESMTPEEKQQMKDKKNSQDKIKVEDKDRAGKTKMDEKKSEDKSDDKQNSTRGDN